MAYGTASYRFVNVDAYPPLGFTPTTYRKYEAERGSRAPHLTPARGHGSFTTATQLPQIPDGPLDSTAGMATHIGSTDRFRP